jgi:hypothetical protein
MFDCKKNLIIPIKITIGIKIYTENLGILILLAVKIEIL